MKKIITINNYLGLNLKLTKRKIVLVCGSFDMFHSGHLQFLEFAKSKGDILVILLNSDTSIKKYKGIHRPIINQKDRSHILSGLEIVDYVIIFNELTPEKYFEQIMPDVFCNGLDWGKNFIGIDILMKNKTRIYYFRKKDSSASKIIQRIHASLLVTENKYFFYDKDFISINKIKLLTKKVVLILKK